MFIAEFAKAQRDSLEYFYEDLGLSLLKMISRSFLKLFHTNGSVSLTIARISPQNTCIYSMTIAGYPSNLSKRPIVYPKRKKKGYVKMARKIK